MPSDLMGNHLSMWDERTEADIRIAQEFLARFRYKPDWHLDITRRPEVGCARLRATATVLDSRELCVPERINIMGEYNLPRLGEMQDPDLFFRDFLRASIRNMELHEVDEWFRVDGKLPFDPHR